MDEAVRTVRAANATRESKGGWISVKDQLPLPETCVLVCVKKDLVLPGSQPYLVTVGFYEDGSIMSENSRIGWDWDFLCETCEYVEAWDDYRVPEGWVEYMTEAHDDYHAAVICGQVDYWMPLPDTTCL